MAALLSGAVESISFGAGTTESAYDMFGGRDYLLDTYALSLGCAQNDMLVPNEGPALFAEYGFATFQSAAKASNWQHAVEACAVVARYGSALPQLLRELDAALRSKSMGKYSL